MDPSSFDLLSDGMLPRIDATPSKSRRDQEESERRHLGARVALLGIALLLFLYRCCAVGASDSTSILLHAPPSIEIALPGITPPSRARAYYSSWRCVGNLEEISDFEHRACVFSDVCYDTVSSDFLFFAAPNNASPPVLYDHRRGERRTFRHRVANGDGDEADFVSLSKQVPYRQRLSWSPRVVYEPVPAREPSTTTLPGLHALSAPFVPTNLGHVAWDEAFPLLVSMAALGIYSPTLQVLRTHGCDSITDSRASRNVCAKFEAAFLDPLLGSRRAAVQTLAQLATAHSLQGGDAAHGRTRRLLCFERLVVGGSFDVFNDERLNSGKEPLLALFRARVLAWHNVPPALAPRRHTILLVRKDGRRALHNFGKVRRHVAARFSRLASVEETSFAGLTMAQQLALVARTTIAVSPCGGISMILPFLPEGAHAILLNYMLGPTDARRHGECKGCSWSMEAELWRHIRHVHKQYYQVWGPGDFARGQPGRDAAVKVDVKRLEGMIASALHDMQPRT